MGFTEKESMLLGLIDEKQLMDYTENLCKEVRLSGTEEELRSFEYTKKVLEGFGLKPELTFEEAYISLPRNAKLNVDGVDYKAITHAMSVNTPPEGVSAGIVYVKKGGKEEYAGKDLTGKFALVDGLAIGGIVRTAQQAGAAGIIFINAEYTHEMIASVVWGSPTPYTIDLLPKIPMVSVTYELGEKIKKQLTEKPGLSAQMHNEVETKWRKIPCLTATIEGNEEKDKYILFSGHIDSWHYGAMDNGTANAGQLEVARILSQQKGLLKRSLRLAFWSGHSHGRYAGSTIYCDTHYEDLYDNCFLHVNIDSLGAKGSSVLTEGNTMRETKDLAATAIKQVANQDFEGARFGRSGDQSFWGTGTPSVFMGLSEQPPMSGVAAEAFATLFGGSKAGGFGWWWHTTEDLMDKIDPQNLKRDVSIYLMVIYRALTDDILPINHVAAISEIKQSVDNYNKMAGGKLDFAQSIARAQKLEELTKKIFSALPAIKDSKQKAVANEYIMELARVLVPLNYVKGSCFEHDLAWRQAVMPMLEEIETLKDTAKGSDEEKMLIALLRRRINGVNFALRKGIALSEQTLEKLG